MQDSDTHACAGPRGARVCGNPRVHACVGPLLWAHFIPRSLETGTLGARGRGRPGYDPCFVHAMSSHALISCQQPSEDLGSATGAISEDSQEMTGQTQSPLGGVCFLGDLWVSPPGGGDPAQRGVVRELLALALTGQPAWPGSPLGPFSPGLPTCPSSPLVPAGPIFPGGPWGPGGPGSPGRPRGPFGNNNNTRQKCQQERR